jgi:hypothetical protein
LLKHKNQQNIKRGNIYKSIFENEKLKIIKITKTQKGKIFIKVFLKMKELKINKFF